MDVPIMKFVKVENLNHKIHLTYKWQNAFRIVGNFKDVSNSKTFELSFNNQGLFTSRLLSSQNLN